MAKEARSACKPSRSCSHSSPRFASFVPCIVLLIALSEIQNIDELESQLGRQRVKNAKGLQSPTLNLAAEFNGCRLFHSDLDVDIEEGGKITYFKVLLKYLGAICRCRA